MWDFLLPFQKHQNYEILILYVPLVNYLVIQLTVSYIYHMPH